LTAPGHSRKNFLDSIHRFRALAIVLIVAGHCYVPAGLHFDAFWEQCVFLFITGGTFYFVFISGFLFHHVYCRHFGYAAFMKKKMRYVLLPYLILGIVPVFISVFIDPSFAFFPYAIKGEGLWAKYALPALKYYATGGFMSAYWYIPFIMIMFALSPLFVAFSKRRARTGLWIVFALMIVSIVIQRPTLSLSPFQSVVYFMPVYLGGMLCSMYKEKLYALGARGELLFSLSGLFYILLQAGAGKIAIYNKSPFVWDGIDFMFFQKASFALFFLIFLKRFEKVKNGVIDTLARTSFAIFFLHPILIKMLYVNSSWLFSAEGKSWTLYVFYILFITFTCMAAALALKLLLPKYSRQITGY